MSLTKRTYTDILGNTLVSTGSVTGATTKLTMVFTANNTLWGVQSTINVYVDGTKVTCTWTANKTETWMGTTYKTKLTSQQLTINKPFFNLKLVNVTSGNEIYNDEFSFYEIEKTPTAATTSGGVMDGSTKSRVVFTTSRYLRCNLYAGELFRNGNVYDEDSRVRNSHRLVQRAAECGNGPGERDVSGQVRGSGLLFLRGEAYGIRAGKCCADSNIHNTF